MSLVATVTLITAMETLEPGESVCVCVFQYEQYESRYLLFEAY